MLLRLGLGVLEPLDSVTDVIGVTSSSRGGDSVVGDVDGDGLISTVSTCVVKPFDSESTDLVDPTVLRRSRCRFTSILLLKYDSKHSSSVTVPPSCGSGIATSNNLSLTNLWSSLASSFPV